jgi:hypothetical protein
MLLVLLLGAVLLGVLWRQLIPYTVKLGDDSETDAAVDCTLALLGVLAGLLTAAFVLIRPGTSAATRSLLAIAGSIAGGVVSWQVGDLIGTPHLRAVAAAFSWPLMTSTFLFLGALLPWTSAGLPVAEQTPAPQLTYRQ